MRQPLMRDNHLLMCPNAFEQPSTLPIPKHQISISISGRDEFPIGTEVHLTRVSCHAVTFEYLFAVLTERVRGVDDDLVVERLAG